MSDKKPPFDYINSVSETKKDMRDDLSGYVPFVVNRALSYFKEAVLIANEMNTRHHLDESLQYRFLFETLPSRRRRAKWYKKTSAQKTEQKLHDQYVEVIMQHHNVSSSEAEEMVVLYDEEELVRLKRIYDVQ